MGNRTSYRRKVSVVAIVCLLAGLLVATMPDAYASAYPVTNKNDAGVGSLRTAIDSANTHPGADTITFSVTGTITLASTLPTITDPAGLKITGPGKSKLTISGNDAVQIFIVQADASLTLRNLSVTHARNEGGSPTEGPYGTKGTSRSSTPNSPTTSPRAASGVPSTSATPPRSPSPTRPFRATTLHVAQLEELGCSNPPPACGGRAAPFAAGVVLGNVVFNVEPPGGYSGRAPFKATLLWDASLNPQLGPVSYFKDGVTPTEITLKKRGSKPKSPCLVTNKKLVTTDPLTNGDWMVVVAINSDPKMRR